MDVRRELLSFFEAHYVPSRMHVAVRGPQDLDELQAMVTECFAGMAGPSSPPPPPLSYAHHGFPFDRKQVGGHGTSITPAACHGTRFG